MQTRSGPLLLDGLLEVGYARVLELRKCVGDSSVRHPRLSLRRSDAARGQAVLLPLVCDACKRIAVGRRLWRLWSGWAAWWR